MSALHRTEWRAVGTTCAAAVTARSHDEREAAWALAAARDEVAACERELSRFDPASDLSRLNAAGGRWTPVGRRLLEALGLALRAREDTGGRFDPTVLPALAAAGYDRSFELLEERQARSADGWRAGTTIELDARTRSREARARLGRRPRRHRQGLCSRPRARGDARRLSELLPAASSTSAATSPFAASLRKAGPGWSPSPTRAAPARRSPFSPWTAGGVATSGRDARRFGPARSLHHLIDPETGESALAGPLTVTVVAPDPAAAEVHATTLAIAGPGEAEAHVAARPRISALYVPHVGPPIPLGQPAARVAAARRERRMTAVPVAWLVARAAGLVAFGLLTLSVWLGLAMSTRLLGPKRQKPLLALHRTLAWTGLSMVGLHLGAILLDPVLHFGALAVLVPGAATLAARRGRARRRRRVADPRPRRLVQRAALDRAEGLAPAPLRDLRGLLARARSRAARRHRSEGLRRPGHRDPRRGPRAVAQLLPAPHAEAGAVARSGDASLPAAG